MLAIVDELDRHALRLLRAPALEQLQDDVLAGDPGLQVAAEDDTARAGRREVDVARRPAEAERRRPDADADRPVSAVSAAVRVGAGDELTRHDQPLLGEVEVEDAVARRGVVGLHHPVARGELPTDRRLPVVRLDAGEHEVIVGDRRLARADRVTARDLVHRVDRERRRAVGGGQQVGVDAQRLARPHLDVPVDAVRPDDLLRRRQPSGRPLVGPVDDRFALDRLAELASADCEDAAGAPDLVLLGRQRQRLVALALRLVGQPPRDRVERELVVVPSVGDRVGALHDLQPEVERVAAEDVTHVLAGDDDQLETDLLGDRLQPRGAHLARRADGEPVAGDQEGLPGVDALAEVGHQVAEGTLLPLLVQRVETLRHAVLGRRDLIRVDRVELLARSLRVPEDQRAAANDAWSAGSPGHGLAARQVVERYARQKSGGSDPVPGR
jgi:hypothetical protein